MSAARQALAWPPAVILAGGLGTRLGHILGGVPKPLARVAGRPFVEWIIRYLWKQGARRIVLSTGHGAEAVDRFAAEVAVPGLELTCVRETTPLGTAGGALNALSGIADRASDVLVCNGDSLVLAGLEPLLRALSDPAADGALLAVRVTDVSRFGAVQTDGGRWLTGFHEKMSAADLVNGGVYLFRRRCLGRLPDRRPLSFEYDVFPALLRAGARIGVEPVDGPFLDIGTEASLREADDFITNHREWFQ